MLLKLPPVQGPGRVQVSVLPAVLQFQPLPALKAGESKESPVPRVSVTVMVPPPCPGCWPPRWRGVSVYVTWLPWATAPVPAGEVRSLTMATSVPDANDRSTLETLLFSLPSGTGEPLSCKPATRNDAETSPWVLDTAGTVMDGAD